MATLGQPEAGAGQASSPVKNPCVSQAARLGWAVSRPPRPRGRAPAPSSPPSPAPPGPRAAAPPFPSGRRRMRGARLRAAPAAAALPCQRAPGRRAAQSSAGQRGCGMAAGLRFDGRVVLVTGAGGGERRPVPGCGVAGGSSFSGGGRVRGEASGGRPGEADTPQPPLPAALTGAPVPAGGSRGRL